MLMQGQVAVVTGASRGIGRAVALELAAAGAKVVVNFKASEEAAVETVNRIVAAGGEAIPFQADVSKESDVKRLSAAAMRQFDRLDILVCNAGIVRDGLAAAMPVDDWDDVIETNLKGPFLCIKECLPEMMHRKAGSIVVISSVAAVHGGRGHCNYSASKGGVNSMVKSLAVELAPRRIRVNAVSPGVIVTDMTQRIRDFAEDEVLAGIPLKRFGEVEEVAKAVRFLASDEASYITGEVLQVTGGLGL